MHRRILTAALTFAVLLAAVAYAPHADAAGIGVSPSTVSFTDMLRGASTQTTLLVYNPDPTTPSNYSVTVNDSVKDAISVTPSNGTIPPKSNVPVTVTATIPTTKANGVYNGTLVIEQHVSGSGAGQVGAITAGSVQVKASYSVTDKQKLSLKVSDMAFFDTEVGSPIVITLNAVNDGNVDATPTLKVTVSNMNGSAVLKQNVTNVTIPAYKTENATAIVPQNLTTGQYRISADVMLAGNRTFNGTGLINVFKAGTLNKTGQLLTLSVGNSVFVNTGDIVKITGTFRNTGQLPVSAKLVCEVTADSTTGKLAGVVDGDPLQVTPNQTLDLTAYYTARDAGRFVINGHALYGDKVSASKSTIINVSASGLDVLPIALAVIVVIGAVGSYYYYRHYRRRKGA